MADVPKILHRTLHSREVWMRRPYEQRYPGQIQERQRDFILLSTMVWQQLSKSVFRSCATSAICIFQKFLPFSYFDFYMWSSFEFFRYHRFEMLWKCQADSWLQRDIFWQRQHIWSVIRQMPVSTRMQVTKSIFQNFIWYERGYFLVRLMKQMIKDVSNGRMTIFFKYLIHILIHVQFKKLRHQDVVCIFSIEGCHGLCESFPFYLIPYFSLKIFSWNKCPFVPIFHRNVPTKP